MRKFPHLKKNRHGVYYFRLIFTQSVRSIYNSPKEVSLSLETKDFLIAQERCMLLYPSARAFRWSLHESVMKGDIDVNTMQLKVAHWKEKNRLRELLAVKDEELFKIRSSLLQSQSENKNLLKQSEHLRDSHTRLEGALKFAKVMMNTNDDAITLPSFSEPTVAEETVMPSMPSDALGSATAIVSTKSNNLSSEEKSHQRVRVKKSETLSAYVEMFIKHEERTSTKVSAGESRRANLMRFLDIVGYDIALTSLTADHIRHYREMMHHIPANFEKQGFDIPKNLSERPQWFKEVISNWNGKKLGGGIDTHFKHVHVCLNWLYEEQYLDRNFVPMLKMEQKRQEQTRKETVNFSSSDLEKLFVDGYLYGDVRDRHEPKEKETEAWKFWIPLIALYSGMRSEEICTLSVDSIVEQEGFWCVQIVDLAQTKTKAGVRTFPIPQRLLDAGLLQYRQKIIDEHPAGKGVRLFPDLPKKGRTYSNKVGQFFNRSRHKENKTGEVRYHGYLPKCGVENPSEVQTLKFHSFRHGFITLLLETNLPNTDRKLDLDLIKNIVGHKSDFKKYGVAADRWDDVTKVTYNHLEGKSLMAKRERFTLMKQAMDAMDFEVDLSGISYKRFIARTK